MMFDTRSRRSRSSGGIDASSARALIPIAEIGFRRSCDTTPSAWSRANVASRAVA